RNTGRNVPDAFTTPMNTDSAWTSRQFRACTDMPRGLLERAATVPPTPATLAGGHHARRPIPDDAPDMPARIDRRTLFIYGGYAAAFAVVALANVLALPPMVRFIVAVVALAAGAVAVGEAVERLSQRLSPAATGVVQSVLGNLPELFLAIFALKAGLLQVVAAALVGSILGNALFVLGLATLVGGLRH